MLSQNPIECGGCISCARHGAIIAPSSASVNHHLQMDFSDWLRNKMREERWNQTEAAAALGVHRRTLKRWLDGTRPEYEQVVEVSKRVHVDREVLLKAAGYPMPSDVPAANDYEAEIVQLVRDVTWNEPRARIARGVLRAMLDD